MWRGSNVRSGLRALVLGLVTAVLMSIVPLGYVLAADVETTTNLAPLDAVLVRNWLTSFSATVSPADAPGQVVFEQSADGSGWTTIATSALVAGAAMAQARIDSNFPLGTVHVRARYEGATGYLTSTSDEQLRSVVRTGTSITAGPHIAPETGAPIPIDVVVTPDNAIGATPTGNVTLKKHATDAVLATGAPNTTIQIPAQPAGSLTIDVTYDGDDNFTGSVGSTVLDVAANSVRATGVGVSATSFYPYKDGYKDSVAIRGQRQEAISVSIKIYNAANSLVRSVSYASGTTSYSFAWNGRTASGTAVAAGKYRVVQALKDSTGLTKTFTSYVTVSWKKLVTKTTYVTKVGDAVSAIGDPGNGSVTHSTSTHVATFKAGSSWVAAGYAFTLPTAVVYKSLAFEVYAKNRSTVPPNLLGMQNFQTCAYSQVWDVGCFDRLRSFGTSTGSLVWKSTSGSVSANRYGKTARGLVYVEVGTVTVYKVRVKVTYQVLV